MAQGHIRIYFFKNNKGCISLTRDTVCNCVLHRKYRYYNFDFLLGQSRCKCLLKKLKLWYLKSRSLEKHEVRGRKP